MNTLAPARCFQRWSIEHAMHPWLISKALNEDFTECVAIRWSFFPAEQKGELTCLGELTVVNLEPLHGWIVGRQEIQNI
jgi:hypothetical protein